MNSAPIAAARILGLRRSPKLKLATTCSNAGAWTSEKTGAMVVPAPDPAYGGGGFGPDGEELRSWT